ncbi:MAG: DNA polymerase domain-containing protein, partial [Candidatus Nanoarchaeia archaeon]
MKIKFFPIDYDYFDWYGRNWIRMVGKTSTGKRVALIDEYKPNFWVILKQGKEKQAEKIEKKISKLEVKQAGRKSKVTDTKIENKQFLGKQVKAIRVYIDNYKDAHAIADKIGFKEVEARREYDLPLITKYIKERQVKPLHCYEVEGEVEDIGLDILTIKANTIKQSEGAYKPSWMGFDIEADKFEIGEGNILMISLYDGKWKKVLTWKQCRKKQNYVECFKDEASMLEAFIQYVKDKDPDFLVGYFSDGFDLPYLRARAEKHNIHLNLGIDDKPVRFSKGRLTQARISGRVHVDIFRFIESVYSQYMQSETLSLDDVSSELLGENKHDFDFENLKQLNESNLRDFFKYNLQDAKLVWQLFDKIWPDILEFTKIMQEPVFKVIRNSMSAHVEDYLIHNLDRYNEIAEKRPLHNEIGKRRAMGKYGGAFVFQPSPGLYENIAMFDFTSMYGSVIVTYNLSKSTLQEDKKHAQEVDIGKKVYFSKEEGFFPSMLREVIQLRKKYKQEYKENKNPLTKARSNAYKLLTNAAYGYQGFFAARYYCREAAAATAALAKKNILEAIDSIKRRGYEIIYSDTDSIAFLCNGRSKQAVLKMLEEINNNLPGIMELELEDFYTRGLFVAKRTTAAGAKKKYALLDEEVNLKVRGFETVRRDWCKLSRELQNKVLKSILEQGNEKQALKIVKEAIDKIKKKQVDKKELIIRTQLKKPL